MNFTIRSFDTKSGVIQVEFNDGTTRSISLPVSEIGTVPTGAELETYIAGFAPVETPAKRIHNAADILSLVVPRTPISGTWVAIRSQRALLLRDSDWTQLRDASLTQEQKDAWRVYREALKNLPQNFASPDAVVWPTPPAFD